MDHGLARRTLFAAFFSILSIAAAVGPPFSNAEAAPSAQSDFHAMRALPLPNGGAIEVGGLRTPDARFVFAVVRVLADGSRDPAFGRGGIVSISIWGAADIADSVALYSDGRIAIAGIAHDPSAYTSPNCVYGDCGGFAAIVRLLPDGRLDPTFRNGEPLILQLSDEDDSTLAGLAVDADGGITVAWNDAGLPRSGHVRSDGVFERTLDDAQRFVPGPIGFVTLIEYHSESLDHYFMTGAPSELAALDNGAFGDWRRTGFAFRAWQPGVDPGSTPVCRLYGRAEFGLNTHFFAAAPRDGTGGECGALLEPRFGGAWMLESANVFEIMPPNRDGTCARGFMPVYRLWNGRSDSNHRFTTSVSIASSMVARGYIREGSGGIDDAAMCALDPTYTYGRPYPSGK